MVIWQEDSVEIEIIQLLIEKVERMNIAISEMERMSKILKEELEYEGEVNFEDLGWKQTLVSEISWYQKYLKILKG